MNVKELERQDDKDNKINEDSIVNGEHTEVIVKKGDLRFEEEICIDKKFFEKNDSIFLAASGLFQLYEKYYTINQLTFRRPRQPGDKEDE